MKQNLHLGEMLKQSLADKLTQLEKEVFDIGALVPIMEVLLKRYKLRLETVGGSAKYYVDTHRYHVTESDEPIIEIGESVYAECQAAFRQLQDMEADFRKIDTAIKIIDKLGYKYLDC
jgi:hypothetical protein